MPDTTDTHGTPDNTPDRNEPRTASRKGHEAMLGADRRAIRDDLARRTAHADPEQRQLWLDIDLGETALVMTHLHGEQAGMAHMQRKHRMRRVEVEACIVLFDAADRGLFTVPADEPLLSPEQCYLAAGLLDMEADGQGRLRLTPADGWRHLGRRRDWTDRCSAVADTIERLRAAKVRPAHDPSQQDGHATGGGA